MRKILEDFMAMLFAAEEENATFTNKEMWLFYGLAGLVVLLLIAFNI